MEWTENVGIKELLEEICKYITNIDSISLICRAYVFASKAHSGVLRKSGKPFITHPLGVAFILAQKRMNANVVTAALLHDVLEDADVTYNDLVDEFGVEVADLVSGVTNISQSKFESHSEEEAFNTRKLIMAIDNNVLILIIKLADRLYNMRTLQYMSEDKKKEKSLETLELFVPMCASLGLYDVKCELEDLCFKYLNPGRYCEISGEVEQIKIVLNPILGEMQEQFNKILLDNKIPNKIKVVYKNVYGIYKKIIEHYEINSVHDMVALKVVVDTISNCYVTLGLIHSKYHHIDIKSKDYIFNPRPNLYRSLHTTLFVPEAHLVQAQIRTEEMDAFAHDGIITRFGADRNSLEIHSHIKKDFVFFKVLEDILNTIEDNQDCIKQIKRELFTTMIGVYTPSGDIIDLPSQATAIDFAYKLGDYYGEHLKEVVINGKYSSPTSVLYDKNRVKIITGEDGGPSKEWIDHAVTFKAKQRILEKFKD